MKVFKFGGASVKDAASVRNIPLILNKYREEKLVVIISAMGKTTNALELLTDAAFSQHENVNEHYLNIYDFHMKLASELFQGKNHEILASLETQFSLLRQWIQSLSSKHKFSYDVCYDQIVPAGELLSTLIVSAFLNEQGYKNTWLDARKMIYTDDTFRAARIDWDSSAEKILKLVPEAFKKASMVVSQGFIGKHGRFTTSLGREGSDFSAAIFGNILNAEEVIVWKDVPGYLNADPKYFKDTVKLDKISYTESIELAFYGAKIIHPKTIRPLKNKNIPLRVKSFLKPEEEGSVIHEDSLKDGLLPSCIIKEDQVLISISSRDFSFIAEDHLSRIFGLFAKHRTGINLMQNSAISFSVCVDKNARLEALKAALQEGFRLKYNDGLQLITIRHYTQEKIKDLTEGKEILLEQRSRITVQMLVK